MAQCGVAGGAGVPIGERAYSEGPCSEARPDLLPGVTGVGDRYRALHFGPGGTRAAMSPAASGPSSSPSCLRPGLPAELADALDDTSFDAELRREADEALALTGKDVGTPIIHFQSPDGVGFFGPVVSRLPSEAEAVPLWDNVLGLASFPGFAELKRRVRERPQLRSFGVEPGQVGVQEDWYAGCRRAPR